MRRPCPWVAAAIAAALFATNLVWNADHHWVSFVKQFGRVAPHGFTPSHLVELILVEFVLLNPVISLFGLRGAVQGVRRSGPPNGPDLSLLLAVSAPFAAYLIAHSLHARVEAHWPSPLYPEMAILAAVAADQVAPGGWWAGLRRAAAPVGLVLSVLVMLHLMIPATDLSSVADPSSRRSATGRVFRRGSRIFAARTTPAGSAPSTRGTAAQLDFELRGGAPVAELMDRDRFPPTDSSSRRTAYQTARPSRRPGPARRRHGGPARVFRLGQTAGYLERGQTPTRTLLVAQPRRDVLGRGCWPSLDAMHAESQRYAAAGFILPPPPSPIAGRP